MTWVMIRSWHAVRTTYVTGGLVTLCGRVVAHGATASVDALPSGKSCETCLRIFARQQDQ
jgi:hypothetical protein